MSSNTTNFPIFKDFDHVIDLLKGRFPNTNTHTEWWQGVNVSRKPEMRMHEIENVVFQVDTKGNEDLGAYAQDIKPNLPWADDHFAERVCGAPINPGKEWKNWPHPNSAAAFLDKDGKFNHNYMERYWPLFAGVVKGFSHGPKEWEDKLNKEYPIGKKLLPKNVGIGGQEYGGLNDLVKCLQSDPHTRQAYFPLFHPSDVGTPGRKPCSLGYWFSCRRNKLNIFYPMRSCDFIRHFRDDIYLTVRLQLWVLQQLRKQDPLFWNNIKMGEFSMTIGSLHMFRNDYKAAHIGGKL